jgi:hypothetical protein
VKERDLQETLAKLMLRRSFDVQVFPAEVEVSLGLLKRGNSFPFPHGAECGHGTVMLSEA